MKLCLQSYKKFEEILGDGIFLYLCARLITINTNNYD